MRHQECLSLTGIECTPQSQYNCASTYVTNAACEFFEVVRKFSFTADVKIDLGAKLLFTKLCARPGMMTPFPTELLHSNLLFFFMAKYFADKVGRFLGNCS